MSRTASAATGRASLVTHLPRHDRIAVRRFTPELEAPRKPVLHDHASVALYLGGHARFWMQGLYTLGAGDLLLVPEGAPHYLVEASGARSIGISLRDVAAHVSRSPAHVASLVKEATGVTVVGWITRARMSESRQLLLHTDQSVDVIAERCGFASPSHFHRAFKRARAMPPGEWRRTHRA